MIDLNKIKDEGLVRLYSSLLKELKDRKIIRTKNIIGDLGEYLTIYHYNKSPGLPNLQEASAGTKNIDAISLDQIRQVASSRIKLDNLAITVVGDRKLLLDKICDIGIPVHTIDIAGEILSKDL